MLRKEDKPQGVHPKRKEMVFFSVFGYFSIIKQN